MIGWFAMLYFFWLKTSQKNKKDSAQAKKWLENAGKLLDDAVKDYEAAKKASDEADQAFENEIGYPVNDQVVKPSSGGEPDPGAMRGSGVPSSRPDTLTGETEMVFNALLSDSNFGGSYSSMISPSNFAPDMDPAFQPLGGDEPSTRSLRLRRRAQILKPDPVSPGMIAAIPSDLLRRG